jgi:hypothetical protein
MNGQIYVENDMQELYYANGYYYPPMFVNPAFPTELPPNQFVRNWPPNYRQMQPENNWKFPQNQGPSQFPARWEESKKLDPSAPAYEQKKKQKQIKIEEKKEVIQLQTNYVEGVKPKGNLKKPLGNAAGNTIRQIINRKKQNIKQLLAKDEQQVCEGELKAKNIPKTEQPMKKMMRNLMLTHRRRILLSRK